MTSLVGAAPFVLGVALGVGDRRASSARWAPLSGWWPAAPSPRLVIGRGAGQPFRGGWLAPTTGSAIVKLTFLGGCAEPVSAVRGFGVVAVAETFFEFGFGGAEGAGEFGKLGAPEEERDDRQDDEELGSDDFAEAEHDSVPFG